MTSRLKQIILLLLLPITDTDASTLQFFSHTQGATDIASLKSMLVDDFNQTTANNASGGFVRHHWGFSFQPSEQWQWSVSERLLGSVETNAATAQIYYNIANKINIPASENPVELHYQLSHAKGFSLHYLGQFMLGHFMQWQYQIGLNHWNIQQFRQSNVQGTIRGSAKGAILGALEFTEYYSDRNFLKRPYKTGAWQNDGNGLSLDVALKFDISPQWAIQIDGRDLWSDIQFDDIGFTAGRINSDNSFVDKSGNLNFNPLLSGKESKTDYKYRLPYQLETRVDWHINTQWALATSYLYNDALPLLQFGVQRQFGQHRVALWLNPRHQLPSASWQYQDFRFQLGIDKLDLDASKQIILAMQVPLWW